MSTEIRQALHEVELNCLALHDVGENATQLKSSRMTNGQSQILASSTTNGKAWCTNPVPEQVTLRFCYSSG